MFHLIERIYGFIADNLQCTSNSIQPNPASNNYLTAPGSGIFPTMSQFPTIEKNSMVDLTRQDDIRTEAEDIPEKWMKMTGTRSKLFRRKDKKP
jgi:hypothetical protein